MTYDIFDNKLDPKRKFPAASGDWEFLADHSRGTLHANFFIGGVWKALDLSGMYFDNCHFSNAHLISCNFFNTRCKSTFKGCKFEGSNFSSTRFQRHDSARVAFLRCSFTGSIWEAGYSFIDCLFYRCDLTDLVLDTDHPFFRTIFKKCLMADVIAERLKMLNAVILN